jgi:hypothetical protein
MDEPNGPRLVASGGEAVRDAPPNMLDMLKDDLGIAAEDTTNDAWLQRRIDNIWARFETYCCRLLPVPPAQFIDDWGAISETQSNRVLPPMIDFWPVGSPFLRYKPVVSIDAITLNGSDSDASLVKFDPESGKLFALNATASGYSHDVSHWLRSERAAITYTAGWAEIPGDLYEALLGCIQPLWQARAAQQGGAAGGVAGTISRINVIDVGEIDLDTGGAFIESATKQRAGGDPLLGPWMTLIDSYVDVRVQLGSPIIPTTRAVPP